MRTTFSVFCTACLWALFYISPLQAAETSNLTDFIPIGPVASPKEATSLSIGLSDVLNNGLSPIRVLNLLQGLGPDTQLATRGAQEAEIYRTISPSVVLVATNDALGSGTVIEDGKILTSLHVVAEGGDIGIIFKPAQEGAKLSAGDVVRGTIIKEDETTDLAIIGYPTGIKTVKPIQLGSESDMEVGDDVSAIGHPTGEAWTYTRGVISQFRRDYKWETKDNITHEADVIQTQTPINPGNSGGPLIANNGRLIGVNAFKAEGEGLNFAIAVTTLRQFISSPITKNMTPHSAIAKTE